MSLSRHRAWGVKRLTSFEMARLCQAQRISTRKACSGQTDASKRADRSRELHWLGRVGRDTCVRDSGRILLSAPATHFLTHDGSTLVTKAV